MFDAHQHPRGAQGWRAARAAGVRSAVLAGEGPADWAALAAAAPPDRHWIAGLHPWWVDRATPPAIDAALAALEAQLAAGGPVGVGECGLDHARARTDEGRARQAAALQAQLDLARAHDLPVVLHVVRATGAALDLVGAVPPPRGGLVHGFVGAREVAKRWHRLGFCVGIGPGLLRSRRLREAVPRLPAAALVLESDDTDPAETLPAVLAALAALRDEDPDHTARYTAANARRLFGLPGGSA